MSGFTKIFAVILLATAPAAFANPPQETLSVRVRTGDIDQATARGQKILALRINRAARQLCDFASDQLGHQVRKIERKCREDAMATAWVAVKIERRMVSR